MTTPGLDRFVEAQEGAYDRALAELRAGCKLSHWMWFVFPQLRGLGRSDTARFYGLDGLDEAAAYLAHPVLGPRLIAAAGAMLSNAGTPPEKVLGATDALKLRSSATLFAAVPGADPVFARLLDTFHGGQPCPLTRNALGATGGGA